MDSIFPPTDTWVFLSYHYYTMVGMLLGWSAVCMVLGVLIGRCWGPIRIVYLAPTIGSVLRAKANRVDDGGDEAPSHRQEDLQQRTAQTQ